MHPDVHLVRTRPPILDVPPLVWIDPPGTPKVQVPLRTLVGMAGSAATA
jgi:hypothetical protein